MVDWLLAVVAVAFGVGLTNEKASGLSRNQKSERKDAVSFLSFCGES